MKVVTPDNGLQEEIRTVFAVAGGVLLLFFILAYLLQRRSLACDLDTLATWNALRAEGVGPISSRPKIATCIIAALSQGMLIAVCWLL